MWHVLHPGDDPLVDWHRIHGDAAHEQGWSLFECTARDHAPIELQRDDGLAYFVSDEAAWIFVVAAAQRGDLACATALHVLASESPREHADIMNATRKETAPCR